MAISSNITNPAGPNTRARYVGPGGVDDSANPYPKKLAGNPSSTFMISLGQDLPLGGDVIPDHVDLQVVRNPNKPSGLTINRMPTYGSGKQNTTKDLGADYSHGPNQKYTYFQPNGRTSKTF